MMIIVTLVFLLSSLAGGQIIQNDVFWKDTDNNPIYSQGGGVIQVGDTWYWYGAHYRGAETYYNNPTVKNGDIALVGVSCYSSKDLVNWKFEGHVFTGSFGWFGRLGVVYHAGTGKYVLIAQASDNQVLFATSSSPTGRFTQHSIQVPPGVVNGGTGDQTVFQDDDGKAYIICSSKSGRSNWYVIPLRASDFLGMEQAVRIGGGAGREGNCMFKYRGRYYFASSDLHGWNTSKSYYLSATNILGPYSAEKVMVNSELDYSHVTQTGFFITVKGTEDTTVIFAGDRWANFAGNGLGFNQWVPLSFDGSDVVFNSLTHWSFDAGKGTWAVAPDNNYILNPAFEADRILTAPLVGWSGSRNVAGSHISGRFSLELTSGSTASQTIPANQRAVVLPNGVYELRAWMQSSGVQGSCQISVSEFGGSAKLVSSTEPSSTWREMHISDISVSTGKIKVEATNNGKTWCRMDNFSLVGKSELFSVTTNPTPGGIITQSPLGTSLAAGIKVDFSAVPLDGWEFVRWSGQHSGTNPQYSVASLASDLSLNAEFLFVGADSANYEAENTKRHNAVVENEHPGFSGSGYANFNNELGSSIEFSVCVAEAGEKQLVITYANGATSDRAVSISVNGQEVVADFDIPSTGSWDVWNTASANIQLNSGVNTIKLTSITANGGPNIDKIELKKEGAVAVRAPFNSSVSSIFYDKVNHTIHARKNEQGVQIKMYSLKGNLVFSSTWYPTSILAQYTIPMASFPGGVYLLQIAPVGKGSLPVVVIVHSRLQTHFH